MEYRNHCNLLPRDVTDNTELGTVSCLHLSLESIRFIPSYHWSSWSYITA